MTAVGSIRRVPAESYNGVSIATEDVPMPTFEESLKKLEVIVEQLEKGDLALEDSLKLFEEGVGLSAACKKELDEAEGKVQVLIKQRDGSLKAEPFLNEKAL
jgi:exodeoxyribonuclease VII small subunit